MTFEYFYYFLTCLLSIPPHYQVIDLNTQLNYFKNMETLLKHKLGEEEANTFLVKAVYLICIGSNDYFVPFTTNSSVLKSYFPEKYVNMVIGNLTTAIRVIAITVYRIFRTNCVRLFLFPFLSWLYLYFDLSGNI